MFVLVELWKWVCLAAYTFPWKWWRCWKYVWYGTSHTTLSKSTCSSSRVPRLRNLQEDVSKAQSNCLFSRVNSRRCPSHFQLLYLQWSYRLPCKFWWYYFWLSTTIASWAIKYQERFEWQSILDWIEICIIRSRRCDINGSLARIRSGHWSSSLCLWSSR